MAATNGSGENSSNDNPPNEEPKIDSTEGLKDLVKLLDSTAKANKKKSPKKSGRIPAGFSRRPQPQTKGQRPICRGCNLEIGYEDECLRHSWKRGNQKFNNVDQFHLRPACVKQMKKVDLRKFLAKKWKDNMVEGVADDIKNKKH